jgi:hypothetical protein
MPKFFDSVKFPTSFLENRRHDSMFHAVSKGVPLFFDNKFKKTKETLVLILVSLVF